MNDIVTTAEPVKKAPRKPRPSEIAAKLAKAAGKTKPKAKAKKAKPAPKRKKIIKKLRKMVKKAAKRAKSKVKAGVISRPARIDMRVTKADKARVLAVAKRSKRTVTSVLLEAVAKVK